MLTGLPVITNRPSGRSVPEFDQAGCITVDNTVEAYLGALRVLLANRRRDSGWAVSRRLRLRHCIPTRQRLVMSPSTENCLPVGRSSPKRH